MRVGSGDDRAAGVRQITAWGQASPNLFRHQLSEPPHFFDNLLDVEVIESKAFFFLTGGDSIQPCFARIADMWSNAKIAALLLPFIAPMAFSNATSAVIEKTPP